MSLYPFTLKFMETVASREDREDAIYRKTSGFGYFLLVPFLPFFLIWMMLYELIRLKIGR
jgi:hypothetical protein